MAIMANAPPLCFYCTSTHSAFIGPNPQLHRGCKWDAMCGRERRNGLGVFQPIVVVFRENICKNAAKTGSRPVAGTNKNARVRASRVARPGGIGLQMAKRDSVGLPASVSSVLTAVSRSPPPHRQPAPQIALRSASASSWYQKQTNRRREGSEEAPGRKRTPDVWVDITGRQQQHRLQATEDNSQTESRTDAIVFVASRRRCGTHRYVQRRLCTKMMVSYCADSLLLLL